MRKLILITLMIWSSSFASTFRDAQRVFNVIQNTCGYHVILKYEKDDEANAYTDGKTVTINSGMLKLCTKDSHLAMVLGHELGHYIMQHPRKGQSSQYELDADQIGYDICRKAQYKKCKQLLINERKEYGEEGDDVHPKWSYRINHLRGKE